MYAARKKSTTVSDCPDGGTENKGRLGANADPWRIAGEYPAQRHNYPLPALPLSAVASAKSAAGSCMNIINGGVHARWQGADFSGVYGDCTMGSLFRTQKLFAGAVIVYQCPRQVLLEKVYPPAWAMKAVLHRPFPLKARQPLELIVEVN